MRPLAALFVALAIAACDKTTPASPGVSAAAGRYGLVSVNDSLLPRTVDKRTDYLLEIVNDTIALAGDGRWSDVTVFRETSGTTVGFFGDAIGGTFEVVGTVASFRATNGDSFTAAIGDGTLTISIGAKAVYRK